MGNLGIASVNLQINSGATNLPNVAKYPKVAAMDVTAKDIFPYTQNDPQQPGSGLALRKISDTYSVLTPAPSLVIIGNYVEGTADADRMTNSNIMWQVVTGKASSGVLGPAIYGAVSKSETAKEQDSKSPNDASDPNYTGPIWKTAGFAKTDGGGDAKFPDIDIGSSSYDDSLIPWAVQVSSTPDIWWAVQTKDVNPGGVDRLPFCVIFWPKQAVKNKVTAMFAIRINPGGTSTAAAGESSSASKSDGAFDIVFTQGAPPQIYDWGVSNNSNDATFEPRVVNLTLTAGVADNSSGILWNVPNSIVITPLGTGIIQVQIIETGQVYSYRRYVTVNTEGSGEELTLSPFKLDISTIMLVGTSCAAGINISPPCLVEARFGTNQVGAPDDNGNYTGEFSGSADGKTPGAGSLATLPQEDGYGLGISASNAGTESSSDPLAVGVGQHGLVNFNLDTAPASPSNNTYTVKMTPGTAGFGAGGGNFPVLPPVFHRIRGVFNKESEQGGGAGGGVGDSLISFTETFSVEELFLINHSVDLVLYNEFGQHNGLLSKSGAVQLQAGWSGASGGTTFTGLSLNASSSWVAGKETLNVHCEDYMFVLSSTMMLNSPFYDGMDVFTAIAELASRAGITAIDDTGKKRYFLGGGYSMTEPLHRYPSNSNLKENIFKLAKQYALVVAFDGDGAFHVSELQGGLAGDSSKISETFTSDPSGGDTEVIIDEKRSGAKYDSVPSQIIVKTVDASMCLEQRGGIIIVGAKNPTPALPFNRVLVNETPVLASLSGAMNWLDANKQRMFKPISSINIRTAGGFSVAPLSTISVDGKASRVMSLSRTFNAEDNSLTTDIGGEWFGDNTI